MLSAVRKILAGLAIGGGATAAMLLIAWAGWLDTAELKSYDLRMRTLRQWAPAVHPDIVLVEINDASIRDLQEFAGRWPWPRALTAILIDYLHRGAPKVIAVDVGFWEKERPASYPFLGEEYTAERSDRELADAVKKAGNVVLLSIPASSVAKSCSGNGSRRRTIWARPSKNDRSLLLHTKSSPRLLQVSATTSSLSIVMALHDGYRHLYGRELDSCRPWGWQQPS
jgi:CHASE2 domain-containing sensor protein